MPARTLFDTASKCSRRPCPRGARLGTLHASDARKVCKLAYLFGEETLKAPSISLHIALSQLEVGVRPLHLTLHACAQYQSSKW
jgi:hypothetical protein